METQYRITNGPSKDRLFDACKYANNKSDKVEVAFAIERPGTNAIYSLSAHVNGIMHEDGSGESFIIAGWFRTRSSNCRFKAYYNTKHRAGIILAAD